MRHPVAPPPTDAAGGHAGAKARPGEDSDGSQLLEFALVLPLLLVLLVGVFDFATAFNIKHIMNNAAREGARIASSQPTSDLDAAAPGSITVIAGAVSRYLKDAGINPDFIGAMNSEGNYTWTFDSSGTNGLKIERKLAVTAPSGNVILATRVTLTYPYNWTFGFNRVVTLIAPNAQYSGSIAITTDALMANMEP